ncbi:MAG TPA: hypothetical protein VFA47_12855 [Candidatus Manganitrophaceae bacterium]|nr:hypothetical protein [Candidatus Manganitrophaceae bacterium]
MADNQVQGKSIIAIAKDIADGFAALNPMMMKRFEQGTYKLLYQQLRKTQTETRSQSFPTHDTQGIRKRNSRLQRLHTALMILEHAAKEKRISLI